MVDLKHFWVSELDVLTWKRAYAPMDIERELQKMILWLDANPRRHKKQWKRFCVGWLNKAHAQLVNQRHEGLRNAEVGKFDAARPVADYSAECAEILRKYPDLA
jgi:hypothetical protein